MSASELARRAGVSVSTVTRVERGELDPTVGMLSKLLEAADARLCVGLEFDDARPELARLTRAWARGPAGDEPDWTAVRALLDHLRHHPELVPAALERRPLPSGSRIVDALLAGLADKLADDAGLPRPSWTRRGRRLPQPWAPPGTPRQTAHRRAHTPEQLAQRNLVIDAKSLWREPVGA